MTRILRERICSTPPELELVLYETELSREFSLSRTPIRQVLQRLAYEQLVRTVSGVGTVVMPMMRDDRPIHLQTQDALVNLVERQAGETLAPWEGAEVLNTSEDYLRVRGVLAERIMACVRDPILEASVAAVLWRDVRWSVHDYAAEPLLNRKALNAILCSPWSSSLQCLRELCRLHAEVIG